MVPQEWAEAGYWKQRPTLAVMGIDTRPGARDRAPPSAFWADYAAYLAQQVTKKQEFDEPTGAGTPFLSNHLECAGRTFTDAAAALAVIGAISLFPCTLSFQEPLTCASNSTDTAETNLRHSVRASA